MVKSVISVPGHSALQQAAMALLVQQEAGRNWCNHFSKDRSFFPGSVPDIHFPKEARCLRFKCPEIAALQPVSTEMFCSQ
jgi:hypothetical protein